jgi:hypothetical protein
MQRLRRLIRRLSVRGLRSSTGGLRGLGALLLAPLALLLLPGCGGGSGGGPQASDGPTSRAALDVYVTDGFSDQYKQVLVTLYKIELTTDGTTFQTVYSNTAGTTVDLASLSSTAELLGSVTVPAGTYTQARITFGDHVTLVTNSGTSTSVAVSTSVGTDTNGQIAITVATPTRVQANQNNTVYVDFNLAEFKLVGSVLQPSIQCGAGTSTQLGMQHTAQLQGTVANLNGTTSFTLQGPNGRTITVALTSTTTITSGQTGSAITLANGQNVIVAGTYDPATTTLTATSVTLNDYTTINHAQAEGTVASINTTAGSFVLTVERAGGIQPTGGTITVATNSSTTFLQGRHQAVSLSTLTVGADVQVNGTFDTTTQTLTANFVGLHP